MSTRSVPRLLQWLARRLIRGADHEFVLGDLAEMYHDLARRRGGLVAGCAFTLWVGRTAVRDFAVEAGAGLRGDLRLAVRQFIKHPRVYANATLVLAIGMGVATFVWGVYYGQYVKGLPVADPDRMVELWFVDSETGSYRSGLSMEDVAVVSASIPDLDQIGLWEARDVHINDRQGPAERIGSLYVSSAMFDLLEIRPLVGRLFRDSETREGAPEVAVLSYRLWEQRYESSEDAVGQTIRINGRTHTIVGVLPEGARFVSSDPLWIPIRSDGNERDYSVLARLRAGADVRAVSARLDNLAQARGSAQMPGWSNVHLFAGRFGRTLFSRNSSTATRVLSTSGFLLLTIALANVANLFLVRSQARVRELAIRRALGGGRLRLLRQLTLEAAVPATLGFFGAAAIAGYGLYWMRAASFDYGGLGPTWISYAIEWPHLVVLACAAALSTVVVTLLAGFHEFSKEDGHALRRGRGVTRSSFGLGRGLLGVQVAAGGTLLLLSGVLLRGAWNLQTVDWGFEIESVMTGEVVLEGERYTDAMARSDFFRDLESRLLELEGVQSATLATLLPMIRYRGSNRIEVGGMAVDRVTDVPTHYADFVTEGFFETFEKPLLAGREFSTADDAASEPVAIVNEPFARRYFSNVSPLGARVRIWNDTVPGAWRTIVGVAPHLWMDTDVNAHPEGIYVPLSQASPGWIQFAIRTNDPPSEYAATIRTTVSGLDPDLPVRDLRTMSTLIHDRTASYRYRNPPLIAVGIAALVLSLVGLYAVVSYLGSLRTPEFGVRAALGASRLDLVARAAKTAVLPTVCGVVVGLSGGLALTKGFDRWVFLSDPWDPWAVAGTFGVLILTSVGSSLIPAIRASRVDLVRVLSSD